MKAAFKKDDFLGTLGDVLRCLSGDVMVGGGSLEVVRTGFFSEPRAVVVWSWFFPRLLARPV